MKAFCFLCRYKHRESLFATPDQQMVEQEGFSETAACHERSPITYNVGVMEKNMLGDMKKMLNMKH